MQQVRAERFNAILNKQHTCSKCSAALQSAPTWSLALCALRCSPLDDSGAGGSGEQEKADAIAIFKEGIRVISKVSQPAETGARARLSVAGIRPTAPNSIAQ